MGVHFYANIRYGKIFNVSQGNFNVETKNLIVIVNLAYPKDESILMIST